MKKLLSLIMMATMMLMAATSCGDSNKNDEPKPDKEKQYVLIYRAIVAKDLFKVVNAELTVLNPVTGKTETIAVTENMDNRTDADCALDYAAVSKAMTASFMKPENFVFYYYKVKGVKASMAYSGKLKLTLDDAKTSTVDKTLKINYSSPLLQKTCLSTDGSYLDIPQFMLNSTSSTIERVIKAFANGRESTVDGTITIKK